jgi:hypothetical protein
MASCLPVAFDRTYWKQISDDWLPGICPSLPVAFDRTYWKLLRHWHGELAIIWSTGRLRSDLLETDLYNAHVVVGAIVKVYRSPLIEPFVKRSILKALT